MTAKAVILLLLASPGLLRSPPLAAQATNPPYLQGFPSVTRVKQAMQVSDPKETALRQIGAFWQLQEIIKALSGHREFRGFLPDEKKLLDAYWLGEYNTAHAADSVFPGPQGKFRHLSDNTPYRYMRTDPRFGVEGLDLFHALLTPAIQAQYDQVVGVERAKIAVRAHEDSIARAEGERRMTAPPGAQPGQPATQLEKEQAGIRRCVESGRSETQCITEGIGKSFTNMMSGFLPAELKPEPLYGLRMAGVYPGTGKFELTFYTDQVTVSCADLVPAQFPYNIAVKNGQAVITIQVAPQPFSLVFRPDEHLAGPGPVDITGQVQVGTEYGTRTWSDGRTEPISRPVYKTFTRHCTAGVLATSGAASPLGSVTTMAASMIGMVFGSPDQNKPQPVPPGLRMSGEYGSQAGFDVEFRPEGAVLGCREVSLLRPYTVQPQSGQVLVKIDNSASPVTLSLGADGRLTGSGTVQVNGRAVTGTTGEGGITYAPRSASCAMGIIGPASGTSQPSQSSDRPTARPSDRPTSPPSGNGAFFQLESGLSGSPNPLAGRPFLLLNDAIENIVKEAGLTPPAGVSAAKYVATCSTTKPECQKLVQSMAGHAVGVFRPDQNGSAQSGEVPAGRTYYVLGSIPVGNGRLIWNLPVVAKVGWTKVTLNQSNAAP